MLQSTKKELQQSSGYVTFDTKNISIARACNKKQHQTMNAINIIEENVQMSVTSAHSNEAILCETLPLECLNGEIG